MYAAVFALLVTMRPVAALPAGTPFTSHDIGVPGAMHREAAKVCVAPAATLADAGEIEFAAAHEMDTLAAADFDGSAVLVAVTDTAAAGGIAGAVYVAEFVPVALNRPTVALPPLTPFTLQLTPELAGAVPLTVAVKFADPPGATFAEFGAMFTAMPLWI